MQVIDGDYLNTVGGYAEVRVLDSLEFLNIGMVRCWEPNGSCIHEKGPYKIHIGDKYVLFADPNWYKQGP